MIHRVFVAAAAAILLAACGPEQTSTPAPTAAPEAAPAAADLATRAQEIAKNSIIIDTHIDVPYRLHDAYEDVSRATDGGDLGQRHYRLAEPGD